MNILIIGGGTMGRAISTRLSQLNIKNIEKIVVCERDQDKWISFKEYSITLVQDFDKTLISNSDVIFIAVKPQDCALVFKELSDFVARQLIISIAAGISLSFMAEYFSLAKIVRTMPNTPAQIGAGITGWISQKNLSVDDKGIVKSLLSCLGADIELEDENLIDAVTALSGCGPAYLFYILQHLISAGTKLGLKPDVATKLAVSTFQGSIALINNSSDDLVTLRNRVTSKGGTTERAIAYFEEKGLGAILKDGVRKAYEKARDLGDNYGLTNSNVKDACQNSNVKCQMSKIHVKSQM